MSVCEQVKGRGERQYTNKAVDAAKKLASRFAELQGMIVNVRQRYQLRPNWKVGKRRGQLAIVRRLLGGDGGWLLGGDGGWPLGGDGGLLGQSERARPERD